MSGKVKDLQKKVDEWINVHLPFFKNKDLSVNEYIKFNSELIFFVIFTRKNDDDIDNLILDFVKENNFLLHDQKYLQTKYLIEIFKKNNLNSSNVIKEIEMQDNNFDFYKSYIDIAELEIICYKNLLFDVKEECIFKKYLNSSAYKNIFSKYPSVTDIYMHTHCIFYLSHLDNKRLNVLKNYDFDRIKYYNFCLLSYAIKINHYDLIGELLICCFLLEPEKDYLKDQLFFVGFNILIQYADGVMVEKDPDINFLKDNYHTMLVIAILTAIM